MALIFFPILGYQKLFLFAFLPGVVAVLAILFVKEAKKMNAEKTETSIQNPALPKMSLGE